MPTALAIAKTAWFVLCLISCFAINNLIVLLISLYITVSQHFKCPIVLARLLHCRFSYFGFSAFCRFSTPFTGKPRRWGLSYKVFWRSFFTQTVWVKNKLCLLKTRQRRVPKIEMFAFHFSQHTHIGEYLDFYTIRFQQYQITFGQPHGTSMQLKLAPD